MDTAGLVLFGSAALALAWVFVLFPAVVALKGRLFPRRTRSAPIEPTVSLIVAAHDEERGIAAKLENALALDWPRDRLEVVVASDGSGDRTEEIVRGWEDRGVRLLSLPRRGKIHALDEGVRASTGDILVFSDANTRIDRGALRALVSPFADPEVGGVCGNQAVALTGSEDAAGRGESLYWRYDRALKRLESATGSIVSADGALYAIRRPLYEQPPSSVNDDFAISTKVIERGRRLVFAPDALAFEDASASAGDEFERKVRIVSRGLWSVLAARVLLDPRRHGFYSLVLFTHKVLRRLTPLFLAGLLAGSLLLAPSGPGWAAVAAAQGVFYLLAAVGALARRTRLGRSRLFGTPFFFCLANVAALRGIVLVLSGKRIELWRPKRRDAIA